MEDENKVPMAMAQATPAGDIPPIPEGFRPVQNLQPVGPGIPVPRILTEPAKPADIPPVPEEFLPSRPALGERATEVGIGMAQGAVRYAPVTAGMVKGAQYGYRAGALAAPFTGPAAPFMPLVGGAIGGITGGIGGYLAGDAMDDVFPAPSREDLVPYREGGITAGGALISSPATFFLRADHATRLGRLLDLAGTAARSRKGLFLGTEALTAGTMGTAGGAMEAYYPGEEGKRFAAELGAGLFTPGRFLINTAAAGYDTLKGALRASKDPLVQQSKQADALYSVLDRVLTEVPQIKQLEELGTPVALQQAQDLRGQYYKNLIKELERISLGGAKPTAAQKTGDIGMAILELSLAKGDPAFGSAVKQQGLDALKANQLLIDALRSTDDQAALALAAQKQAELYDAMVAGRLGMAEREAVNAAQRINMNVKENRPALGQFLKGRTEEALKEVRDYEGRLYSAADQASRRAVGGKVVPVQVTPSNFLESTLDFIGNMLPETYATTFPAELKGVISRYGITDESIASYRKGMLTPEYAETGRVPREYLIGGLETKTGKVVVPSRTGFEAPTETIIQPLGKPIDAPELVQLRSNLLGFARDAASGQGQRSPSQARMFGMLAESVLDDLQTIDNVAWDKARTFSRSVNDVFRRSFADPVLGVTRTGAEKIPAEILVSRSFGGDTDVAALRMRQLTDAVGFFKRAYDDAVAKFGPDSAEALDLKPLADTAATNVTSVTEAMEKVLRLAATEPGLLNPQTGQVNPQALSNWMAKRGELLKPFGALTNDLKDAVRAENAFRALGDPNSAANRQIREQQAFAVLLPGGRDRVEVPAEVVTSAINSTNPVSAVRKLVDIAQNQKAGGGPEAMRGLKAALYEYAYTKAGGTNNTKMSIQAFEDALFKPLAPKHPSLINIMRANGLMTPLEVLNLKRVIEPWKRVESAMDNQVYLEQVLEGMGPVGELGVKFLALHGAAEAVPQGPASLAAASAVSKAARDVFARMPQINALAGLKEIVRDPKLTAELIKVGRTNAEKTAIIGNVAEQLAAAGIIGTVGPRTVVPFGTSTPDATAEVEQRREAARMLRRLPPAPTTRGVPGMGGQGAQPTPPAPPGQAPGGATSQSRAMLQSLFPFDTISAMAAQPPQALPPG